jgi:predicted metal-binding protein
MAEMKEMFSRYSWGIIIHAHDKHTSQKASFAVESAAFHDNYYFAMSLSDCGLCKECAAVQCEDCRFVGMARPAFHSVGIDVFKTVRQMGLPIETLPNRDHPDQNWYSAVFVE